MDIRKLRKDLTVLVTKDIPLFTREFVSQRTPWELRRLMIANLTLLGLIIGLWIWMVVAAVSNIRASLATGVPIPDSVVYIGALKFFVGAGITWPMFKIAEKETEVRKRLGGDYYRPGKKQ